MDTEKPKQTSTTPPLSTNKESTKPTPFHKHRAFIPLLIVLVIIVGAGMFGISNPQILSLFSPVKPTPTQIQQKPTPTLQPTITKIPTATPSASVSTLPTKVFAPRATSTPSISPTPGQLGFHVPDASVILNKGDCGEAMILTSHTSTQFHFDPVPYYHPNFYWEVPSGTMEKGTTRKIFMCLAPNATGDVCQTNGCSYTMFHDDTTGASKNVRVCHSLKCQ